MLQLTMIRKLIAEFTGTFLLIFCGTGAIVINEASGGAVTHPGIAAAFGISVFVLILLFAPVSGAHMNPAVTITQAIRRKNSAGEALLFVPAQISGAFAASLLLHLLFPASEKLGATLPSGSEWQSFVFEFLLTFFLMLGIIRMSEGGFSLQVIAATVGGIVGLEALFAGPVCGASMNPARSLAPAIVSGHTEHLWLYIAAPVTGALASALFSKIFMPQTSQN